jgi:hypothetical protein
MTEKTEMTQEQFITMQRVESLARQNAQQALRIADLEAQLALIGQQAQQAQQQEQSDVEFEPVDEDATVQ